MKRDDAGNDTRPIEEILGDRARVLSVFGPFNSMALVAIPVDVANRIWEDLAAAARPDAVAAVEAELELMRARDPKVADSALAAAALSMAYELIDPFNSATSKSMCAARLMDAMADLRALLPQKRKVDEIDDLAAQRQRRQLAARAAAAANLSLPE